MLSGRAQAAVNADISNMNTKITILRTWLCLELDENSFYRGISSYFCIVDTDICLFLSEVRTEALYFLHAFTHKAGSMDTDECLSLMCFENVSLSPMWHTHSCYTELVFPSGLISPSEWLTTLSESLSKQVYSHPLRPLQSIVLALLLNPLRMCFGQLWNLCLLHICRQLQSTPNPNSPKYPQLWYKKFQRPLKDWIQVPVENRFVTTFSKTLDLSVCSPTPVLNGQDPKHLFRLSYVEGDNLYFFLHSHTICIRNYLKQIINIIKNKCLHLTMPPNPKHTTNKQMQSSKEELLFWCY